MLIPKIKEKRMEAHLSQKELAELIGMNTSQLSKLEHGKLYGYAISLWKIAKFCNCKVDDLYELQE